MAVLDLASPLTALLLANVLIGMRTYISDIRNCTRLMGCSMIAEMHLHCLLSWRIDTRLIEDRVASNRKDMITKWVKKQMSIRRSV